MGTDNFGALSDIPYTGTVLMFGTTGARKPFVGYALSDFGLKGGERKLTLGNREGTIKSSSTDAAFTAMHGSSYVNYPAVFVTPGQAVGAGNGRHTQELYKHASEPKYVGEAARDTLEKTLREESHMYDDARDMWHPRLQFERDSHRTPRLFGMARGRTWAAIMRLFHHDPARREQRWDDPLEAGKAAVVCTYHGSADDEFVPFHDREYISVNVNSVHPEDIAESMMMALQAGPHPEYIVGTGAHVLHITGPEVAILPGEFSSGKPERFSSLELNNGMFPV